MKLKIFIKGKIFKIVSILNILIYSIKASNNEKKLVRTCSKYKFHTQTKYSIWNTLKTFNKVIKNNVEGDIVECGVWQGINLVLFQKLIEIKKISNKKIYGFDTFEGIPIPTKNDITKDNKPMINEYKNMTKKDGSSGWNYASLKEVKKNYTENTKKNDNLILIKGKVENTLSSKKNIPNKICILRLDTSLYEGTKIELKNLFPRVQSGGVVIVEGYEQFKGVKKATDEYLQSKMYDSNFFPILGRLVIYL